MIKKEGMYVHVSESNTCDLVGGRRAPYMDSRMPLSLFMGSCCVCAKTPKHTLSTNTGMNLSV